MGVPVVRILGVVERAKVLIHRFQGRSFWGGGLLRTRKGGKLCGSTTSAWGNDQAKGRSAGGGVCKGGFSQGSAVNCAV